MKNKDGLFFYTMRFVKIGLYTIFFYMCLVGFALLASVAMTDQDFERRLLDDLSRKDGCINDIKWRSVSVLNPFEFYSNPTYWLASARLSDSLLMNEGCFRLIVNRAITEKSKKIVFVNKKSEVSFVFTKK